MTIWTPIVWHALHRWEKDAWRARRSGFRMRVAIRNDGSVHAQLEECLPPIHAVETVAENAWSRRSVADAQRWCEKVADRIRAVRVGSVVEES